MVWILGNIKDIRAIMTLENVSWSYDGELGALMNQSVEDLPYITQRHTSPHSGLMGKLALQGLAQIAGVGTHATRPQGTPPLARWIPVVVTMATAIVDGMLSLTILGSHHAQGSYIPYCSP